jgi:predicted aconitase with swiveling domain
MSADNLTLAPGVARGRVARLSAPLSLWGGFSSETGRIVDANHPERGLELAGRILVMDGGRGSSSASSTLAEAIRRGTAPAAILLTRPDPILVIGSLVAADLYGREIPIVLVADRDWPRLIDGVEVAVNAGEDEAALTF